ncbi:MAG: threonylcarbamoyl-AMP synthase [Candidatus Eremiobacteraeota bacterium]|nr:threonylcarbamoyl-AMP synthase [Candidatus Eremiobacteraeota bacterium]
MSVLRADTVAIASAAAALGAGACVAFPTETVYGLGAVAFDARAVARIFEIKARPTFDPLIVHVLDMEMLARVARDVPPLAARLAQRFWPGALTLVLAKRPEIPGIVTSGLESVAARMPAHPVARALLAAVGQPIAAPSANSFGRLSPTSAEHVRAQLGELVEIILDGGATPLGIESTIVAFDPVPTLLRHGAIAREAIEAEIGPLLDATAPVDGSTPQAPGQLLQHYAPQTPIRVIESLPPRDRRADAAYLGFHEGAEGYAAQRVLSPAGNDAEAAAHFFEYLHELDALGLERIDAARVPNRGLGAAIADRLARASVR